MKEEDIKIPIVKQEAGMPNDSFGYFININNP